MIAVALVLPVAAILVVAAFAKLASPATAAEAVRALLPDLTQRRSFQVVAGISLVEAATAIALFIAPGGAPTRAVRIAAGLLFLGFVPVIGRLRHVNKPCGCLGKQGDTRESTVVAYAKAIVPAVLAVAAAAAPAQVSAGTRAPAATAITGAAVLLLATLYAVRLRTSRSPLYVSAEQLEAEVTGAATLQRALPIAREASDVKTPTRRTVLTSTAAIAGLGVTSAAWPAVTRASASAQKAKIDAVPLDSAVAIGLIDRAKNDSALYTMLAHAQSLGMKPDWERASAAIVTTAAWSRPQVMLPLDAHQARIAWTPARKTVAKKAVSYPSFSLLMTEDVSQDAFAYDEALWPNIADLLRDHAPATLASLAAPYALRPSRSEAALDPGQCTSCEQNAKDRCYDATAAVGIGCVAGLGGAIGVCLFTFGFGCPAGALGAGVACSGSFAGSQVYCEGRQSNCASCCCDPGGCKSCTY